MGGPADESPRSRQVHPDRRRHVIAHCPVTGLSASGVSKADAFNALVRIIAARAR